MDNDPGQFLKSKVLFLDLLELLVGIPSVPSQANEQPDRESYHGGYHSHRERLCVCGFNFHDN